jgi:peptidoglycan/LPS O-acetylase OafA/YrhL
LTSPSFIDGRCSHRGRSGSGRWSIMSSESRIASLDLLRGLAAYAVAIPHYLILNSTDYPVAEAISILAVECFFVLSGFVLAPQLMLVGKSREVRTLRIFLIRRWMRTVPPYMCALAAISLAAGQLLTTDFLRYLFYVQNLQAPNNFKDYFPIAWSLSVEEWFYVSFSLLIFVATRFRRNPSERFAVGLALVFILAVAAARSIFGDFANWDESVRRVVIFRLDTIAVGFVLYFFVRDFNSTSVKIVAGWSVLFVAAFITAISVTLHTAGDGHVVAKEAFGFVAPLFGATAIGLFFSFPKPSNWAANVCVFLGRISYSIYLFHMLTIVLIRPHLAPYPLWVQIVVYLFCISGFSTVFYLYFERPILAARPSYRNPIGAEADVVA